MHNDLSFKLKFQNSGLDNLESVYTEPIKPKYFSKENITRYSYFDDKNNFFVFDNLFFSLNELRSTNLTLNIYDTKLEIDEEEQNDKDKEMENEKDVSERSLSPVKKKNTLLVYTSKTLLNLKKRYNQIGYANINFYKILSQNDNIIMKTASKVFQTFSLLYTGNVETKNKLSPKTKQINPEHNNFHTNGNMEEKQSTPRADTWLSKEIKFQVFDDISKHFTEKIYLRGAEIGQVISI